MPKYVDTKQLEACWGRWNKTSSKEAWRMLSDGVYKICCGVATQFHPQSEDEHLELAHHAFALTMHRIKIGMLAFTPGKAPVFNLLTTAVFRILYSYKTSEKRKSSKIVRYGRRAFENLSLYGEPRSGRIITCRSPLVKHCLDQNSTRSHEH